MKKQLHALRVAYENWHEKSRFDALLRLLKEYDCGITQIALFSSSVHTPLTIPETERRAEIMKERLSALKECGYTAGINVLATIGHHEEDLPHTVTGRYQTMVNKDGKTCCGTVCMNDTAYQEEYVSEIYRIYAETSPDFIWIDDDIRYGHMPIGDGCFCDRCISLFNRAHGYDFSRETLRDALSEDRTEEHFVRLRREWLDHNSDAICGLFRVIGSTVRGTDPAVTLGFMTGERYFEGYQFARYADALSDGGKYEIMWRPGGGAYTDFNFEEIVEKSEQIGRQNAYLPPYVTTVLSEIENFPYNLLKKTPKSTAFEAALTMTAGCTGAAFNILPSETGEPIETVLPHLRAIAGLKPFYEEFQKRTEGLTPVGIHTGWRPDSEASRGFFRGTGWQYGAFSREFFSFGLPQAFHPDAATVTILTGTEAAVMSDAEILRLLSGGLYIDAAAANDLTVRGFGAYLGFSVAEKIPVDARECYTNHPVNEGFSGGIRNCRQAFNPGDSYSLLPLSGASEILTFLIDYHGNVLSDCAMGLFRNSLGGRVCVAGYYPFTWISDYYKTIQLKRVFRMLSDDTLPAWAENYCRVRVTALAGEGKQCVTVFNPSNDTQENLKILIRTEQDTASLLTMYEGSRVLHGETVQDGTRAFVIDLLKPYEGVAISL